MKFIETPITIPDEIREGGVDTWGGQIASAELSENEGKTQQELTKELDAAQREKSQKMGSFIRERLAELEGVEL